MNTKSDMDTFGVTPQMRNCMTEIAEVLRRHQLDGQLGVQIIHTHFPVAEDEVMFESIDESTRTQSFQPLPKHSLDPQDVWVSCWEPVSGRPILMCPRTHKCHQLMPQEEEQIAVPA